MFFINLKGSQQGRTYFNIWLVGNAFLWAVTLAYLILKAPTYESNWVISVPEGNSTTNVNLPDIGNASSQSSSPFSNSQVSDPRENYKFLASSKEIRKAAASQLDMTLGELGAPQVDILTNTTLMEFQVDGNTPQEAYEKALAIQNALENKLNQLREQEIAQQDLTLEKTLDSSRRQLQQAQQRLSEYKARFPAGSQAQMGNLSTNIEDLRRQKSEIQAQQKQIVGRLKDLSSNLNLSVQEAADALVLQSDLLFRQYAADYSRINGELINLQAKFLPANPTVVDKQAEKKEAFSALMQRAESLLKRPISPAFLDQLNLNPSSSDDINRASLMQELISLQAQRQGLQSQVQELEEQIGSLENRASSLSQQESTLAELQRNVKIAEAVFSSTMTKLDLSTSNIFASYPQIQVVNQPVLPEKPSSPNIIFALLGTSAGSLFLTTGLFLLWWRNYRNQELNQGKKPTKLHLLLNSNQSNDSPSSKI